MSTKTTICDGFGYHIYQELYEEGLVCLQIINPIGISYDTWEASQGKITITLTEKMMKEIAEHYMSRVADE